VIGLVAVTAAGRAHAARLAPTLHDDVMLYDGRAGDALPRAFRECDEVIAFMATGVAVRILAPLLADKTTDPGVVCVDETARYAVALVGGHEGGANQLAREVAEALGCEPVVTTATESAGLSLFDMFDFPVEGDVAAVTRAILDGERVTLVADAIWPLPALPPNVVAAATPEPPCIIVTDRLVDPPRPAIVVRPRSLVVGVGASSGVSADEVLGLIDAALAEGGLSKDSIGALATIDVKFDEPGIREVIDRQGWSASFQPAGVLADIDVPNPSEVVQGAVGTPSVAEAAALGHAAAELVVPKRKSAMATVAIARQQPSGRLAIVGLGPGARDLLTPRAVAALKRASVVVGLDQYVDQIRDLLTPGTRVLATRLGQEEERARTAVAEAEAGHAVALVGSGDAQVYAMASPALEAADQYLHVEVIPGITAALAAAAEIEGAPLGHDHCAISLSDLHTPWEVIERRIRAAAEADFVVSFYNPRSGQRDWQLAKALEILREHRPATTPVAVVTNAERPHCEQHLCPIDEVELGCVGMYSLVIVGSSQSRIINGRFVTPRGYTWAG
jgi:cobalt-precorrin 5A hydrolase/precorrin-3B C17-methyltransferase